MVVQSLGEEADTAREEQPMAVFAELVVPCEHVSFRRPRRAVLVELGERLRDPFR